ncbi:unnamed protein product [Rotaria socialis]|uniref:Uncharacterized protein n=1 Tax=Rotaria socialis TaxID=392032 RepID=A0A820EAR7_9BILA|nr:unnamed protein product [Rotaria socialis]
MTQKEANFAESTQLTRNDQEKIGTLNLLISTSTQPSNSLFNYYQERAEILFYLNKYEDALSDINAMEKINEIPSSIKLIKWKSLIQIQCAKVSQEIKQSLAIQVIFPGESIRYRIPSDSMGSYHPTKSRWIPG